MTAIGIIGQGGTRCTGKEYRADRGSQDLFNGAS